MARGSIRSTSPHPLRAPTGAGSTAGNLCSTGATLSVAPSAVNVAAAANSAGYVQHYFQHQLDSYRQSIVADSKPDIRFKQWNGNCNGARKHKRFCAHGDRHRFRNRRSITNGNCNTKRRREAAGATFRQCLLCILADQFFLSGSIYIHEWRTGDHKG